MNPQDTSPADGTMDTPFDTALRRHFQGDAEPDDGGFRQRVMAALPRQAVQRRIRWDHWALHAHWAAISLGACGLAALASMGDGQLDGAQGLATYTLIGLLIFWAIPNRWSRG
jgi:hypothetical protein